MRRIHQRLFGRYWNPYLSVLITGVLSALYFGITGTAWAVTGEFTRLGGEICELFGVDVARWKYFQMIGLRGSPLTRTDGWIVIGMLAGALIAVLLGRDFKLRVPRQKRRLVQGFAGGVLAGFGARLALGCNLAAFFTGIPQFSFHAWIFMLTTGVGTFLGVQVVKTRWWRGTPDLSRLRRATPAAGSAQSRSRQRAWMQPLIGAVLGLVFLAVTAAYAVAGNRLLAVAALFGAAFGILIQRGQICFTAAFRDLWVSGRATMSKALAIGMMAGTVVTFVFIETGTPALIHVSAPSTALGGLIFGLGIVLAGGCETGMMYRAMEGQVHFWLVFVGNIAGATALAYAWDHLGIYDHLVTGWPSINLIDSWGAQTALLGTLALLAGWLAFSLWWERHYRYGKGLEQDTTAAYETVTAD